MFFPTLHQNSCFSQNLLVIPQELHGTEDVYASLIDSGVNWKYYQSWLGTWLFSSVSFPVSLVAVTLTSTEGGCISNS